MEVIALTLLVSLLLALIFMALFLRNHAPSRPSTPEHDALLPLADEAPREASNRPREAPDRASAPNHASDTKA